MNVERVTQATDDVVDALRRLLPQLSQTASPPTREELATLIASGTRLFVARQADTTIVGALSLGLYLVPTGLKGIVEDVVVDEAARGQGVGEALVRAAQAAAAEAGATSVGLTSRPEREAANRLYRRLGFELRTTNRYVWRPG
jgi:ribosomal protein S18 acetylase RimI-like enzyme